MSASVIETFTNEERKALVDDGTTLYLPTGETIRDQQKAKRPFWFVPTGDARLLDLPARRIEVAIYADPERFFVPGSFTKTTDQQDELLAQNAEGLRNRLGLKGITMIRPKASEATEILFKHLDVTGVRLLDKDYIDRENGYWRYMRTATSTNRFRSNSSLVFVGGWDADSGLNVNDWNCDVSYVALGVARWVIPQRTSVVFP